MCLAWVWDCFSPPIPIRFLAADPDRKAGSVPETWAGWAASGAASIIVNAIIIWPTPAPKPPILAPACCGTGEITRTVPRLACPARIRIRTFRLRLPVTTKVHKFNADFGKRCDNVGSMCQVLGHPEDTPCPVVVGHITRPRLSPHSCSLLLPPPGSPTKLEPPLTTPWNSMHFRVGICRWFIVWTRRASAPLQIAQWFGASIKWVLGKKEHGNWFHF